MLDWLTQPVQADLPAPTYAEIRGALRRTRPDLADAEYIALDEGWAFRAYRAGDWVLRFPKREQYVTTLPAEVRLLPILAPALPLPISVTEMHEGGPHGLPFTSHRFVAGVKAEYVTSLAPASGETLGRFLRALHDFPTQTAVDCGIAYNEGASWRAQRGQLYEITIRRCFPLVSCEARRHIEQTFETYLNDDANFAFRPALLHGDIDERNVLADPETGELTGVIDWGDALIADPALDLTGPLVGDLSKGGLKDQFEALQRAYGEPLDALLPRCRFYEFCWPLFHLLQGLLTDDAEFIEDGIRKVNDAVPVGVRCD
jgi:aminoglycoside 2''-phosphotransferase